jgi:hypothetical protein
MNNSPKTCPDCGTPTEAIKLLDATALGGMSGDGIQHVDLAYAAPDARASFVHSGVLALTLGRKTIAATSANAVRLDLANQGACWTLG